MKGGNNRSVMPLDVLGRTRTTMGCTIGLPIKRLMGNRRKQFLDWDCPLKLWDMKEEFLVDASHQLASTTSLPFVHTARRSYRLSGLVKFTD